LLVLLLLIGLVVFLAWRGMERGAGRGETAPPSSRQPRPPSVAPDDDPEFLRDLDRRMRGEDPAK
jgi:hypothetical protein